MDTENYVEQLLRDFVEAAEDKDFIILIDPQDPGQFVQFMRRQETIYGEVSSRQWGPPGTDRPISYASEFGLMRLGFTHGGKAKNYAADGLSGDGRFLANIAKQTFATAYGQSLPEVPRVASTVSAVESRAMAVGGPTEVVKPGSRGPRGWPCPICDRRDPFVGVRHRTGPGLLNRARRAARSNFVRVQLDCEDQVVFVDAVCESRTFDELPEQVQDWIIKAEEGPLFG